MRIVEKCSCGASVEVEYNSNKLAEEYVVRWREKHLHSVRQPHTYGSPYSNVAPVSHDTVRKWTA